MKSDSSKTKNRNVNNLLTAWYEETKSRRDRVKGKSRSRDKYRTCNNWNIHFSFLHSMDNDICVCVARSDNATN